MSTTIDAEVQRLVQAEIDRKEAARVERIKAQVLERQADEQRRQERLQRIDQERARAAQLRDQAAAIRAEAEPHLSALERIEGSRPALGRCKSQLLEEEADRFDLGAKYHQFRLEHPQ